MVPLSTLVTVNDVAGTEITTRFNLLRSVEINGAPGVVITEGASRLTGFGLDFNNRTRQLELKARVNGTFVRRTG